MGTRFQCYFLSTLPTPESCNGTKTEALNSILGTAEDHVRDISIVHATTPTSQTQHMQQWWVASGCSAQKAVSYPLARADRGAHHSAGCTLLLPCTKNTLVYCHQQRRLRVRRNARDSLTCCASCTFWSSDWKSSAFPLSSSVSLQTPQKRRWKLESVCFLPSLQLLASFPKQ